MRTVTASSSAQPREHQHEGIPAGWKTLTLTEIVGDGVFCDGDWVESKDQDPNGDVRLIQLADIGDGTYRDRSSRFLTTSKAKQLRCTFLAKGDVLVARMPDPLGRACVFPGDRRPAVTVVDICILRAEENRFNPRWLMHAINTPTFRSEINDLQSGTTRKRISRTNLASLSLVVPPRDGQDKLLQVLEARLSRLDKAVEDLRSVEAKLVRHRASVLAAATSGSLVPTEADLARREGRTYEPASVLLDRILAERRTRWEADQIASFRAKGKVPRDDKWKAKYDPPVAPNTTDLPELPEGWVWASLDQVLGEPLINGRSVVDAEFGFPVLRLTAIRNGVINPAEHKIGNWSAEQAHPFLINIGDFLIARGNGSKSLVGRGGLVLSIPRPTAFPDTMIRVRASPSVIAPQFLALTWDSTIVRHYIEQKARTTAGIYKVNQDILSLVALPIPPMAEQIRISAKVSEIDPATRVLSGTRARSEIRARSLRSAILQAAFQPTQATTGASHGNR